MGCSAHPGWLAPGRTCVDGVLAELLFDAHELIVFGVAVGTARRPGLDLPSAEAYREVGDGGVLCLARAVRAHDTPAALLAQLHRLDGFGDGANLIHLQK